MQCLLYRIFFIANVTTRTFKFQRVLHGHGLNPMHPPVAQLQDMDCLAQKEVTE